MNDLDELGRPGAWDSDPEQALSPVTTDPAAAEKTTGRGPAATRRGAADPVKALMHRHRELCERAVDPLEIAAGLEAHGLTDRSAARFRHRDVFSLAEEMFARVSRNGDGPRPATPDGPGVRAGWVLLTLLPGTLCAAAVTATHLAHGRSRLLAVAAGTLAVALALRAASRRGPLSPSDRATPRPTGAWVCWLLAYSLLGDGLLRSAVAGGPDGLPTGTADGPWPLTAAPVLALTLACAPAAWTAHLFTARARRKLAASRGLEDFAAAVRPLLLGAFALFLGALTALLTLCTAVLDEPSAYAEVLTLGALLFLARLLTTHGFTYAPAV
ncbi:integral membrane protein, partial [Streptomyces viridochromogenes DSM 40736]